LKGEEEEEGEEVYILYWLATSDSMLQDINIVG